VVGMDLRVIDFFYALEAPDAIIYDTVITVA
jgi:hypothetical protein